MTREPLIFKISFSVYKSESYIDEIRNNLNENRYMIDGYDLLFLFIRSSNDSENIECIYPIFKGDEEILKLQKENMTILNNILKEKLNPSENIGIIQNIFRKLKLNRII